MKKCIGRPLRRRLPIGIKSLFKIREDDYHCLETPAMILRLIGEDCLPLLAAPGRSRYVESGAV